MHTNILIPSVHPADRKHSGIRGAAPPSLSYPCGGRAKKNGREGGRFDEWFSKEGSDQNRPFLAMMGVLRLPAKVTFLRSFEPSMARATLERLPTA